jgi:glycosyltransferase involved in cell wall biosynthesis
VKRVIDIKKVPISVCIPTYNSGKTIVATLRSLLNQSIHNFEIVIVDDASKDSTIKKIKKFKDPRIRIYKNNQNIGCGKNLDKCKDKAMGEIIVFLAGDDLFDKYALEKILNAFKTSKDVGLVIRPYFWFIGNDKSPVRVTRNFSKDTVVSMRSDFDRIIDVIALSDQMSGVSFRKKLLDFSFNNQPFVEMASAVMKVLKSKKAIILKDYILGVRIGNNGSTNPKVYLNSPVEVWKNTLYSEYSENRFNKMRKYILRNFIATNYVGLIQIKNFGTTRQLVREISLLIRYRWINLLSYKFLFFTGISLLVPRLFLRQLVEIFKAKINSRTIEKIIFDPGLNIK